MTISLFSGIGNLKLCLPADDNTIFGASSSTSPYDDPKYLPTGPEIEAQLLAEAQAAALLQAQAEQPARAAQPKQRTPKYDIFDINEPLPPRLGKGMERLKDIVSYATPTMRIPLLAQLFPVLASHMVNCQAEYYDGDVRKIAGIMCHLIGESGCGKGQLTRLNNLLAKELIEHDDKQLLLMKEHKKQKAAAKNKKDQPEDKVFPLWNPPTDITGPGYKQLAYANEEEDKHSMLFNMPEIDMFSRMTGGSRQVSIHLRNIYDGFCDGSYRATADGVTGKATLRANISVSSTPDSARQFFKYALRNGTYGRMVCTFVPPIENPDGKIPQVRKFDDDFLARVDRYVAKLKYVSNTTLHVAKLNKLANELSQDLTFVANTYDDRAVYELMKRAVETAWRCGIICYVLNDCQWTRAIGEFVTWLAYHDLWSKFQVYGDMLARSEEGQQELSNRGPENMLSELGEIFTVEEHEELRVAKGLDRNGENQRKQWKHRHHITYDKEKKAFINHYRLNHRGQS